ncbi:MAG: MFS transporter [Actinomycetota bacterium]
MTPEPTGAAVPNAAAPGGTLGRTSTPGSGFAPDSPPAGFAGWRILAVAVATTILTGPGQTIGVSVFIDPMVEALGVTRSTVSAAYLVGTLVGASALPVFGRFVDRRGVRLAQMLVGAGFAMALVNMAGVRNALWLAVGFAGIRMLGQGALSMIPSVAVALWFDRRRGVALGILTTVGGAGMAAVPLVLNLAIEATSWRVAWLLAAAVITVTVIPLGYFGLIDRPESVGQVPDGRHPDGQVLDGRHPDGQVPDGQVPDGQVPDGQQAPGSRAVETGAESSSSAATLAPVPASSPALPRQRSLTRGEAARTLQFWILAAVNTATGMLITGLNFHQIDLLGEAGLDAGRAAAMFLPQIVGSSVMAIGVGVVVDRVGVRFVPAFAMALLVVVHLLAAFVQPGLLVFVYAVSLGATGGAARAAIGTLLPAYFGTDHIGSIQGVMTVTGVAGSAAGPVTLALVEGWLGGYRAANLVLLVIPIAALLFTLGNRPRLA